MKTAISIPDSIYKAADKLAAYLGMTRSALYTKAIKKLILEYRDDRITEKLNTVYKKESSNIDPVLEKIQAISVDKGEW